MLYGSQITAIGLSIVALLVSKQFSFFHTVAKFLGVASSLLILCFFIVQKKTPFSLPLSKNIKLSFFVSFLALALSLTLSKMGEPVTGLSLILLFLLLSFSISALSKQEGQENFLKRLIFFQMPAIAFMFLMLAYHELFVKTYVRPFFGNPNVAGNFVAISLIQILFFIELTKDKLLKRAGFFFLTIGTFVLFSLAARAPLLGLLLGVATFFSLKLQLFSHLKRNKNKLLVFGFAFAACILIGFFLYSKGSASLEIRYSFWRNTLCLIKDFPLGVGAGSFEYIFQGYNGRCFPPAEAGEGLLVRNPHNMFLELFAELGIVGALAFFAFYVFSFLEIFKSHTKNHLPTRWILSLSALLLCIGFFEFPQDTPYTFFILSVLSGLMLSLLASKTNPHSQYLRVANFSAAIVVVLIFFIKAYSDHLTLHSGVNKKQSYATACALNNENWRACVFLGLAYIEENDFEKAEEVIALVSKRFSGHHSLLHLKGTYFDKRGEITKACEEFGKYHLLFDKKTSKAAYLEKNCPKY